MNMMQTESTSRDSFDLFSGLFVHNRFAKQQVMNWLFFHHILSIGAQISGSTIHVQLRDLEVAFKSIKQRLENRNEELEQS